MALYFVAGGVYLLCGYIYVTGCEVGRGVKERCGRRKGTTPPPTTKSTARQDIKLTETKAPSSPKAKPKGPPRASDDDTRSAAPSYHTKGSAAPSYKSSSGGHSSPSTRAATPLPCLPARHAESANADPCPSVPAVPGTTDTSLPGTTV